MSFDIFAPSHAAAGAQPKQSQASSVMQSLIDTLRQQQSAQQAEVDQLGFLGAGFDCCPFPMWIKSIQPDGSYRMARVNRAFENQTGISGATYFAKTDVEIWGDEVGVISEVADREAHASGHPVECIPQTIPDPQSGKLYQWCGIRWPIYVRGKIAGIAGMSTRNEVSQ